MTFTTRLAALAALAAAGSTEYALVVALGVDATGYTADTAMIRDLFRGLRAGSGMDIRTRTDGCSGIVGASALGCDLVRAYNTLAESEGFRLSDMNGNYSPAIWLEALVTVIASEYARLAALPEYAADFDSPEDCWMEGQN
jgi:hypothetical protein